MNKYTSKESVDWPYLFSKNNYRLTINQWIKVFSVMWLTYLLFNTINPITKIIARAEANLLFDSGISDIVIILLTGFVYLSLITLGVVWASGFHGLKRLFAKPRLGNIWYIILYGLLFIIFTNIGNIIAEFIPYSFEIDITNTLEAAQFESIALFIITSIYYFFIYFAHQIINIMIFFAMYQLLCKLIPKNKKIIMFLTYIFSSIIAGALTTTPVNGFVFHNILIGGLGQIPLYWAFRKSKNILIPTISVFLANGITMFFILKMVSFF
ncbi:hypothetical protein [Miniphocaeibacter halophilus]|uniref:Uncharacterized protein n=1 Tax=Miniphocaeibacter halophilus TaxID=2931922 RepID=A0AC61NBN9_9FIRM|nr:hypothetical protein [Miniphocaeibacter halophilus]QQK08573.1 hypothetical protein JFY71_03265 [Miniphocaeibacter halophilus]